MSSASERSTSFSLVHLTTCDGNRSAAVFSSASWNDGISTFSPASCSLVKWISSSGVSATMVAVRSEWFRIAVSPTMSPGPSWATSSPWERTETLPLRMM